jgi:autotransporter strand-loop-strand O-heptosyltransferase
MNNNTINIRFDAHAVGDNICWMPYVEEYRRITGKTVLVSTFFNELFAPVYPKLIFVEPNNYIHNIEKIYIGVKVDSLGNERRSLKNWQEIPLQQVPCELLGLKYKPIKPKVQCSGVEIPYDKYICITEHTTRKNKYWYYKNGWQNVVDYLRMIGYQVVVCSKEPTTLKNIIDRTGNHDLRNRAKLLKEAEMLISPSTGLAWMAHAVGTPVVMISGSTKRWHEFECYRAENLEVCNGCINNSENKFNDKLDCPENKNYECSREVTSDMVIEQIIKCVEDNNVNK